MIFLVDDNEELREALEEFIRSRGHEVRAFAAAEPALAAVCPQVELLITDIRLPCMDGLELVARLRKGQPTLPVIIISSVHPGTAVEISRTSTTVFLRKPLGLSQLETAIGAALAVRWSGDRSTGMAIRF